MTTLHGTARYRRQLAAWLREWHTDQALPWPSIRDCPDASSRQRMGGEASDCAPPHPGEIRLIKPPSTPVSAPRRPVYILVLHASGPASVLMAVPFGRFASPAVPGEWRTGLRVPALRVLCGWNARLVTHRWLGTRSWPAGSVPRRVQGLADRACRTGTLAHGRALPGQAHGPPLRHPLDPRWRYLQEEADLVEDLIGAETPQPEVTPASQYPTPAHEELKAAEPHASYGHEAT